MARTGESGSLCTDRKRDTTASSDGFEATARSWENSGNPSERSMGALSPFLCYGTTEKRSAVSFQLPAFSSQLSALSHGLRRCRELLALAFGFLRCACGGVHM